MNILLISKYAKASSSDAPSRQFLFSKALVKRGHNVMLGFSRSNGFINQPFKGECFCKDEAGVQTIMMNGPLVSLGMNFMRVWSWVLFEYKLFRNYKKFLKFEPDVIIVSSLSILTFIFGVFLKKRLKKPLILEVRDLYPLTLLEIGNFSKYNPIVFFLAVIEKFGYKNADSIISTLENTKSYFENRIRGRVNFHCLPMGCDDNLYLDKGNNETSLIIDKIRGLKEQGRFIVGYAGAIGNANALDELFKVATDNEMAKSGVDFVIIGEGPRKGYFRSKYTSTNIHYFDPIEKKFLPLVLQECHILINCWLDRDIYKYGISPNKWIEYMFSARPVLLSFNARSRIFDEAKFGWKIPAQDPEELKNEILRISSLSSSVLNRIGKQGKRYLESNLNYDNLTIKLENIIDQCIKK